MSRRPGRAGFPGLALLGLALVGLGLGLLASPGAPGLAQENPGPVGVADPGAVTSAAADDRIILATGPLVGVVEPCRCTEGMLGGLPRRGSLVARFATSKPDLVDLGDLAKPDEPSETNLELVESAAIEALGTIAGLSSQSGPALAACGCTEVRLGLERLQKIVAPFAGKTKLLWPVNLTPQSGTSSLTEVGASVALTHPVHGVVFVAAIDPALVTETDELKVNTVPGAFVTAFPGDDKSYRTIVLYHGEAAAAARDFEGDLAARVTLVICGHAEHSEPTRRLKNGVWLVTLGQKGQTLRALALPSSGADVVKIGLRAEASHDLDALVPDQAAVRAVLDRLYDKQATLVPDAPKEKPNEQGGLYVGTDVCLECHSNGDPNVGQVWHDSRHAHALEKLREKDPRRAKLAECLRCHTVGFDYDGGWKADTKTEGLGAVGCESCHGPGSNHVARAREAPETALGFGRPPGPWPIRWRGRCLSCHDPANSPGFDLEVYLGRIRHWKNGDR